MSAPIPHTCPEIDKYIKSIKQCILHDRQLKNMDEKELYNAAYYMSAELENCIEYLESLRESNRVLREYGEEMEERCKELNEVLNATP